MEPARLAHPPPDPPTVGPHASARSLIRENDSPDIPFTHSINPYQGCEHGCSYCFARPSHAYLDLSPGLDFETKIFAKTNAVELLRKELRRPGYRATPIALGANTDPYQPAERRLRITRGILELLAECSHPVNIVTKSAGVLRDLDVLAPMAARNLCAVYVSITTLDPGLARRMEPRAAAPARRLETVRALADAGVPVGVMASPMIPGLNFPELEAILEAAAAAGARTASTLLLRLPHELKTVFEEWLREREPTRADRVLSLLRQMRGGKLNDPRFGHRMRGSGPFAELLSQRFRIAARRHGLATDHRRPLDASSFRPPAAAGDQGSLF